MQRRRISIQIGGYWVRRYSRTPYRFVVALPPDVTGGAPRVIGWRSSLGPARSLRRRHPGAVVEGVKIDGSQLALPL